MFIFAATSSAVGLGNIWKFPYIAGQYGGGAFILVYLGCMLLIALPLMVAEVMIGRRGGQSPINSWRAVSFDERRGPLWGLFGWLAVGTALLMLSAYSVVGGWALAYAVRAAAGVLVHLDKVKAAETFFFLRSDPEKLLAWHTIFMGMTVMVVSQGIRFGLEEAARWLLPAMFLILAALVWRAEQTPYFFEGLRYLFHPQFAKLGWKAVLVAMGHAFFTMSLGMGVLMTYGAYLGERVSVMGVSVAVVLADVLVALVAGVAIFPILFATHQAPASGPALVFQVMPVAFAHIAQGRLFETLFFLLLVFAAWTSAIAMLEPAVAYLVERRRLERALAASYVGLAVWALGLVSILSFNVWKQVRPLRQYPAFAHSNLFDLLNFLTANIMLPLGGLAVALFVGWRMTRETRREELGVGVVYKLWLFAIRYVTPVAVVVILLYSTGLLKD